MIMALIYRNVPRKKTSEMLLLGERLTAEEAREAGIVNRVVPATSSTRRSPGGPRLASKSPLMMRLGKDAIGASGHAPGRGARLSAFAADDRALDRGCGRGRDGVLREARARMEGDDDGSDEVPEGRSGRQGGRGSRGAAREGRQAQGPHRRPLHARREAAKLGGGEEKIAKQHAAGKLTARERIDLLVDPGTFVELGIHAGPHFSQRAMDGKEAPADGVITGWGDVDGRPSRSPPTTSR